MIDISRGGLAFWEKDSIESSFLAGELSIKNSMNDFDLRKIPFKLLPGDEQVRPQLSKESKKRRYRLQFESLSSHQISQLSYFLENHTSLKARQ